MRVGNQILDHFDGHPDVGTVFTVAALGEELDEIDRILLEDEAVAVQERPVGKRLVDVHRAQAVGVVHDRPNIEHVILPAKFLVVVVIRPPLIVEDRGVHVFKIPIEGDVGGFSVHMVARGDAAGGVFFLENSTHIRF